MTKEHRTKTWRYDTLGNKKPADMISKICGGCKIEKAFEDFNKSSTGFLGLHNHCRACQKVAKRRYYVNNREKELEISKIRNRSENSRQSAKRRYENNKEIMLAANRDRRRTPEARKKANDAKRALEQRNPSAKLARNMRIRIRIAIKGRAKSAKTMEILGCEFEHLQRHLERQFKRGMTWDNYGINGWHVDHIRPCASFDLSDPGQYKACFHFTNLQPLWNVENISKGGKVTVLL